MDSQRIRELMALYRRDSPWLLTSAFQWGEVLVQPYPVSATVGKTVGPVAALRISQLPTIQQLVALLSSEHRDQHDRLLYGLRHFRELLIQQLQKKQRDNCCNILLVVVDAFELLVQCVRRQVHDQLLCNLQALVVEECFCAAAFISTRDIEAVMELIQYFNEEYQRFYEELTTTLYSGESLLASNEGQLELQEELIVVLMLVERSILLEAALKAGLQSWRKILCDQELQLFLN